MIKIVSLFIALPAMLSASFDKNWHFSVQIVYIWLQVRVGLDAPKTCYILKVESYGNFLYRQHNCGNFSFVKLLCISRTKKAESNLCLNSKKKNQINPFHATDLFWYPLETSENLWFSNAFRGYQKRWVAWNELMRWMCSNHWVQTKERSQATDPCRSPLTH